MSSSALNFKCKYDRTTLQSVGAHLDLIGKEPPA